MTDNYFFEELEGINDAELYDGLWEVLCSSFRQRKSREKALAGTEKIIDLYLAPVLANFYREVPRQAGGNYRTRSELITVSQNPRLVEMLIEYGFLEPHPKWPFEMWDHSETPYRPVVSQFVEVRAGAILKNST